MPIDTSIYSAAMPRQKSVIDYQNELQQQDLSRQSLQQNSLAIQQGQQKLSEYSRSLQAQQGIRNRLQSLAPDATDTDRANALYTEGSPESIAAGDKFRAASDSSRKTNSEASHLDAQTTGLQLQNRTAKANQAIVDIANLSNPADAIASLNRHFAAGDIDQDKYDSVKNTIPPDPSQFPTWKRNMVISIMDAKDKLTALTPDVDMKNTGGFIVPVNKNANAGPVGPIAGAAPMVMTRTPDGIAHDNTQVQVAGMNNATSRDNNRDTIAKDFAVNGMNQDGSIRALATDGSGKIDISKVAPEDLAAAYRYKSDGTLPPNMGRGQQGAVESRKLRAIAAALDDQAGESPEDARVRQLALKGDVSAINKMRQREVAVGANVKNFDFNADQVMQLSSKVDRTGVPIANAWLNAGRRAVTGNPELAAFDTAVKTTVNEFAQIVSGTTSGASTEGEKKKAEALLNAQQTPEGISAVISQMRIESKNRMASFAAQRRESMPTNKAGGAAPVADAGVGVASGMPSVSDIDTELARRKGGKK